MLNHAHRPTRRPFPHIWGFALAASALLLAACTDEAGHAKNTFPMSQVVRFDQPVPSKPLFADPIITLHDVLPKAAADSKEPLPPAVPLPAVTAAAAAAIPDIKPGAPGTDSGAVINVSPENKGGGVNPAAGQAAAITDSQGAQHSLGSTGNK